MFNYQAVFMLLHLSEAQAEKFHTDREAPQRSANCSFCTTNQNGTNHTIDLSRASSSAWTFWVLKFQISSSCRTKWGHEARVTKINWGKSPSTCTSWPPSTTLLAIRRFFRKRWHKQPPTPATMWSTSKHCDISPDEGTTSDCLNQPLLCNCTYICGHTL